MAVFFETDLRCTVFHMDDLHQITGINMEKMVLSSFSFQKCTEKREEQ